MKPAFRPTALALATLTLAAATWAQTPPPPPAPDARAPTAGPIAPPPHPRRGPRPTPPATPMADATAQTTVSGRVLRWLPNPNGEVDGLLLEGGTQVAFPPHLSTSLLAAVKPNDTVQVTGVRGPGAQVLRASQILNTASGRTVADTGPAPDAQPPRPPEPGAQEGAPDRAKFPHPPRGAGQAQPGPGGALTAMSTTGRIATLLYTDRGDLNGVLLDNGTVVRFPPHVGASMAPDLKAGAPLFARGYGTRSSQGSAFEATRIGATEALARDIFTPPGGPVANLSTSP